MPDTDRDLRRLRFLTGLRNYVTLLLLLSFVLTCSMLLFLYIVRRSMGLIFTREDIRMAAVATFVNMILISMLLTLVERIRYRMMVERPVRRITAATEKIMRGDLTARIEPFPAIGVDPGFHAIISCINRMAEELGSVETLRTDFISNVSHELKTPLSVIQNYSALLQSPRLPEEARNEYASVIQRTSRQLAGLITSILKLNRLENQQIYPENSRFNLGELLAERLLTFESVWEEKQIELETDLAEDVFVESDRDLLSLVWDNLFSNAFKFTGPHGTVAVSLAAGADSAIVQVRDTGCGISPEAGKHIFEKFYQGDPSHATQGNGLGLALVKRVVDIIGASISVESEEGKGSVFSITLRRTL